VRLRPEGGADRLRAAAAQVRPTLGTVVALTLLVVFWASAFPAIKIALDGMGPAHLTLARHLVASVALLGFLALFRARPWPQRRDVAGFVGLGAIGITTYHLALNFGEVHVSAGASSLIIATAPALTALVAWWLTGDRLPALGWWGTGVAFGGVALIVVGDGAVGEVHPAAALVLLSALATAFLAVLQRRFLGRYRPLEVTAYLTWGGTLPLLVFLPGLGEALVGAGTPALLATLHLGVVPSAIAYTLFAVALARASAPIVTSFLYLVPVVALLLSWWWLGEVPSVLTLVGGAIAVVGVTLVQRAKRRPRPLAIGASA
jgi:drug/metabolite transporter (DMT)-like permease